VTDLRARRGIVTAIIAKDLRTYARDRFYLVVTIMGLAAYIGIFWVLPATADDEPVALGAHMPGGAELLAERSGDQGGGFSIVVFDSSAELQAAVEAGTDVVAGLDFPPRFLFDAQGGMRTTVRVLLGGDAPEELRPLLRSGVAEIVAAISGLEPPVRLPDMQDVVVGPDLAGQQLSLRDRMRPLLLFLVLMVEMIALASLVAAEIAQRTVTAVLVTPARVADVLIAKSILGTLLAFSQALLLALATQTLGASPLLLLVVLLLGSVLVTGFGLIAGSTGKDFIGIIFWSMLFLIPLTVPALATLFPGTAAGWIQGLPTYGLVQVIVGVTAYGEGWSQAWPHLVSLTVWCALAFAVGVSVLSRRAERV
jgi:ABC-2 type transport system permease protein